MLIFRSSMKYIDFSINNPRCIHCYISDRAYASVITEVMANGRNETGGAFLGYIINRAWYIVESVDPGIDTVNQVDYFQWDADYVNHQAKRLGQIYSRPLTILGFWHRHPGSMDYFSNQDETTIRNNLREFRVGLLSMLVNIDPKLRMTFYYCYENDIMQIKYDVGNKYFPAELLKYADANELSDRAAKAGRRLEIHYEQVIDLEAIAARKKNKAVSTSLPGDKLEEVPHKQVSAERMAQVQTGQKNLAEHVPDETINRIIRIVTGIEENSKVQSEELEKRLCNIEKDISKISEKLDLFFAKQEREDSSTVVCLEGGSKGIDEESCSENYDTAIAVKTSEYLDDSGHPQSEDDENEKEPSAIDAGSDPAVKGEDQEWM